MLRPFLKVQMWFCVAGARDFASCQKRTKEREGFVAFPKTMGGVGYLKRTGKMHVTWQAQCKRHVYQSVRRSGRRFPERGCSLEHFEKSQNALVRGRQLCTQLSSFEGSLAELLRFLRFSASKTEESHRIALFLMLPTSKIEEVFAELLRFWRCQVETFRTSRRIAAFSR